MHVHLSLTQIRGLKTLLRTCADARIYKRTLAILEISRGRSVTEVSTLLGVGRKSIYNWLDAFLSHPVPESLEDDHRTGRPTLWRGDVVKCLERALGSEPDEFGYQAVGWTTPLLREHLKAYTKVSISDNTVRAQLHRMRYAWKRPRYVLIPDPDRDKKNYKSIK
jgi:transposase